MQRTSYSLGLVALLLGLAACQDDLTRPDTGVAGEIAGDFVGGSSQKANIAVVGNVGACAADPAGIVAQLQSAVALWRSTGTLSAGNAHALSSKLSAAATALAANRKEAARGQLGAFLNQLNAFVKAGTLKHHLVEFEVTCTRQARQALLHAPAPLPASKLSFVVQPGAVAAGVPISPAVQVAVQDANGTTVTSAAASITISITSGAGATSAVLAGTLVQSAVNGVATFSDLTIDKAGGAYSITATAPNTGLSSATSTAFPVGAGTPTQISAGGGSTTGLAGAPVAAPPSTVVKDANGNPVGGVTVVYSVVSGGGSISGATQTTNANGVATVGSWTLGSNIGPNQLIATAPELAGSPVTFTAVGTISAGNFALDFLQSYVSVPDDTALDLTTTWTLEAWVFPRNATSGADQDIIAKWAGVTDAAYILQVDGVGRLRLVTNNGLTQTIAVSTGTLSNNQWRHVAATFEGTGSTGTIRLYLDGSLDATYPASLTPINSSQPLAFGREGNYAGGTFSGLIDDVRLWKVARTGAELAALRSQKLTGSETGLVGLWRFNEGSGDVVFDASGRGNHGRLGTTVGVDLWDPRWSSTLAAPIP